RAGNFALGQRAQVGRILGGAGGQVAQLGRVDIAAAEGDFLGTGDLEAGALFNDLDELARVIKGGVRAAVQPGHAAAKVLHAELILCEVDAVDVGDLEFAAGG